MLKNTLREISKFLSGMVACKFLTAWWLYAAGLVPLSVLGIQISSRGLILAMVFDVIIFLFLVYYGWQIKDKCHSSGERTFHRVAGTIFGLVALAHLLRLIFGLPINLLSWNTPYWVSGIAAVIAGFLSYASFRLTKKD